ncbi:hypothetical protein [Deinococcus hohokamensis]|uniref:Phospholipase C/D domain-containing protein n=1 Tax=Deinococcus hohokamensis TaxID=309883 RepID=A0ABV9I7B2_9DEIO
MTHLVRPGEDEGRIPDLAFWRRWLEGAQARSPAEDAFVLGYFTHLVSDNLWMHFVGSATQETFAAEFAANRAATWGRVKADWYGLDFKHLRDVPDNVFARVVMPAAHPISPLPFLPTEALAHRLDDLRAFYGSPSGGPLNRPYPYLSEATMTQVIEPILALVRQLEAGEVPVHERVSLKVLALPARCCPGRRAGPVG